MPGDAEAINCKKEGRKGAKDRAKRKKATTEVDDDSVRNEKGVEGEGRVRDRRRRKAADSRSRNGLVLPAWQRETKKDARNEGDGAHTCARMFG